MISRPVFPVFSPTRVVERRAVLPESVDDLGVIRQRAWSDGVAAGRREGRAQAHAEWNATLAGLARGLDGAAAELARRRTELADVLDRELPGVVLMLARKIVERDVTDEDAALALIRRIAERLVDDGPIVARLSAAAAELFEKWRADDARGGAAGYCRVDVDPALEPGEWVIEMRDAILDGRLDARLAEAWRVLTESE